MGTFTNHEFTHSSHAEMVGRVVQNPAGLDEVVISISEPHNKRYCELTLSLNEFASFKYYMDSSAPAPEFMGSGQGFPSVLTETSSEPISTEPDPLILTDDPGDTKTLAEKTADHNARKAIDGAV